MKKHFLLLSLIILTQNLYAIKWGSPDWSADVSLAPGSDRSNVYNLSEEDFKEARRKGMIHALKWPVEITGLLVPYEPLRYFLEEEKRNPVRRLVERMAKKKLGYKSLDGMYEWLGLNKYPDENAPSVFQIPYPEGKRPDYRMGVSILDTPHGKGLTFSCAACHSGTFLGRSVMGLPNKRSRANDFFVLAKKFVPYIPAGFFKASTNATANEKKMFRQTQLNLRFVNSRLPQVLGLDTASAHVGLSLSSRADDEFATKDPYYSYFPRPHKLETFVADSKPMPWWNLKYKTRWLSDGSIVAGNPILMNILWNELGRGTDLKELETWVKNNDEKVKELTTAVFGVKAPRWTDFFDEKTIQIARAKKGEVVFNQTCKRCHGVYQKGWSLPNSKEMSVSEQIKTVKVFYHSKTPIKDVGTDSQLHEGAPELADSLNKFKISKTMGIKMKHTDGYVPPPLVGVFMRYPYLHNNSIPNLCALMERPDRRPTRWVQGPSDKASDFDHECVGYPVGANIPKRWWKEKGAIFDVRKPGLSNSGHDAMFWNVNGSPRHSTEERRNLLEYLKTL